MSTPEVLTVPASKFIVAETGKFQRSHTRIYLALILDVIHAHASATPKGYAAMLQSVAPHVSTWPKYCTVIAHAIASKHAPVLADFPATATGLTAAVAWYENVAKDGGYSLSLEDMVRCMQGKWSVKAQQDQAKQASDIITAAAVAARATNATEETARKALADAASNTRSATAQAQAEATHAKPLTLVSSTVTPGPVLGEGWTSHMVTVHDKGGEVIVNGIEDMDVSTVLGMLEYLTDFLKATQEAQGKALAA